MLWGATTVTGRAGWCVLPVCTCPAGAHATVCGEVGEQPDPTVLSVFTAMSTMLSAREVEAALWYRRPVPQQGARRLRTRTCTAARDP